MEEMQPGGPNTGFAVCEQAWDGVAWWEQVLSRHQRCCGTSSVSISTVLIRNKSICWPDSKFFICQGLQSHREVHILVFF